MVVSSFRLSLLVLGVVFSVFRSYFARLATYWDAYFRRAGLDFETYKRWLLVGGLAGIIFGVFSLLMLPLDGLQTPTPAQKGQSLGLLIVQGAVILLIRRSAVREALSSKDRILFKVGTRVVYEVIAILSALIFIVLALLGIFGVVCIV